MIKIQLGDEVKHTITGVRGIAIARTSYLSGCDRITIQPKVKKDGTLGDNYAFDEPEIEVIKPKKVKRNGNKTGGWKPEIKPKQVYLKK